MEAFTNGSTPTVRENKWESEKTKGDVKTDLQKNEKVIT